MARLLTAALAAGGHAIVTASRLRSYEGAGDSERQKKIARLGHRIAERLVRCWAGAGADQRPDLWFTYHLYHKAPDWVGPWVCDHLGIPYVVAEASHAAKRARGPWADGLAAAASAIARADLLFVLNSADTQGLRPLLCPSSRLVPLPPFVDAAAFVAASNDPVARLATRRRHGIPAETPLIACVAMMRPGDKLASYRLLADALARIAGRAWRLMVIGDGPARAAVAAAFAPLHERVHWIGRIDEAELPALYAAADLCAWPAIGEAWGMALIEAQAAGVPVVAGRSGGVADVVADGTTGLLAPIGDAHALASAIAVLLDEPLRRRQMGRAARRRVQARHDVAAAAATLNDALRALVGRARRIA